MLVVLLLSFRTGIAQAETGDIDQSDDVLTCSIFLDGANAGREKYLNDGDISTCVRVRHDSTIELSFPSEAAYVYIIWHSIPISPVLHFTDEKGTTVSMIEMDTTLLCQSYEIPDGSCGVSVGAASSFAVSELTVYQDLPEDILLPGHPLEKTDILLVVAHTGDEAYYFGGLLPILAGEKNYSVTVLFLSSRTRLAQHEALLSLQDSGIREQPIFLDFAYRLRPPGGNVSWLVWEERVVSSTLSELIRLYRPEIVITHDPSGEDDDVMHAYTEELVRLGIEKAAYQGKGSGDSVLPTWQVACLYEHDVSLEGLILPVDKPLPAFEGLTARTLAQRAFDRYSSLRLYQKTNEAAGAAGYFLAEEYRVPLFDPFLDLSIAPMPTAEPVVTAEPEHTPEPEELQSDIAPVDKEADGLYLFLQTYRMIILGGCGLISVVLFICLMLSSVKKSLIRYVLCAIPLSLGLVFVIILLPVFQEHTARKASLLIPDFTAAPISTPVPTVTPNPSPTSAPSPTPDPNDRFFQQEGEPEEIVVFDNQNNTYSYRSSMLSVEIQQYDAFNEDERPLRYYVAHVRTRENNAFRPAFGTYRENGRDPADPFFMARHYKAVIAITGDNMIHSDQEKKSVILRNGRAFQDFRGGSAMVFTPDGLEMYTKPGRFVDAQDLLDAGIENTYSFGPILISDGVLNEEADMHYLSKLNPRVGLGLIEKGHFVILVVEGRVAKYSYGVRLGEFARMFADLGCVEAYNLDGGASSCLLFMGEYINKRMPNQARDIPDLLMWGYSELVPALDELPVNEGFYSG